MTRSNILKVLKLILILSLLLFIWWIWKYTDEQYVSVPRDSTSGFSETSTIQFKAGEAEVIRSSRQSIYVGEAHPLESRIGSKAASVSENAAESDPVTVIHPVDYIQYATDVLNIRAGPSVDCPTRGQLSIGDRVRVIGEIEGNDFVKISHNGYTAYIHSSYLSDTRPQVGWTVKYRWKGEILNRSDGVANGPSGKETYYNLDMGKVVKNMHAKGFKGDYWVRTDGCKMLGSYIMVATDTYRWPKGTVIETSLGTAIVCDHCDAATKQSKMLIDVAVNW